MIDVLNRLVDLVEEHLTDEIDVERPAFRLIGHAVRAPLIHEGVNPHIHAFVTSLPEEEHLSLKELSNTEPAGLLQVSDDVDPDATEGTELTYLHGVAVTAISPGPSVVAVLDRTEDFSTATCELWLSVERA